MLDDTCLIGEHAVRLRVELLGFFVVCCIRQTIVFPLYYTHTHTHTHTHRTHTLPTNIRYQTADNFLKKDPTNCVMTLCKSGKGRTGETLLGLTSGMRPHSSSMSKGLMPNRCTRLSFRRAHRLTEPRACLVFKPTRYTRVCFFEM